MFCRLRRAGALVFCVCLLAVNAAAQIEQVNLAPDGTPVRLAPIPSVISRDGHTVLFTAAVSSEPFDIWKLYVRNLETKTTISLPLTLRFPPRDLSISDAGDVAAFSSLERFGPEAANACAAEVGSTDTCESVYIYDLASSQLQLASVASDGRAANRFSTGAMLAADGRYVIFTSSATNLAPADHNFGNDIFRHDRLTGQTVRVSVDSQGREGHKEPRLRQVSADGQRVLFIADGMMFEDNPAGESKPDRLFLRDLLAGTTRQIEPSHGWTDTTSVLDGGMSADGNVIFAKQQPREVGPNAYPGWELYDLARGRVTSSLDLGLHATAYYSSGSMSDDGRLIAEWTSTGPPYLFDRVTGEAKVLTEVDWIRGLAFASSAHRLLLDARLRFPGDPAHFVDGIFVYDLDADHDGIPSAWEEPFGLNPNDATDADADPDHDGLTNIQEYQAHSHPTAIMTRYFAEGAANGFFFTRIAVLNLSATANAIVVRMIGANGETTSQVQTLPGNTRGTFELGNAPDTAFSIVVEGTGAFVADRLMTWDQTGYGSSLETSIAAPGTTWQLAEGATGGPFSLYYLLQNPGDAPAQATVTYLRPTPLSPIVKTYDLAAHSRHTIDVTGEDPGLAAGDVSATITADRPIVVERAMYYSTPGQPMAAGHDGVGIETPAPRWFLAEGATGFFDEFVLIANPQPQDAAVTVAYLLPNGEHFSEDIAVTKQSRFTLEVKARDPRLVATPVAIIVESTNATPIVVERVMWWPAGAWYEASLSAGVTGTGTAWAMAEGEQGGAANQQTYVLIANTENVEGHGTVSVFYEDGTTASAAVVLPANSRTSVDIGDQFPPSAGKRFGISVTTDTQSVVERSLYSTVNGRLWDAGGTSVATNISPRKLTSGAAGGTPIRRPAR